MLISTVYSWPPPPSRLLLLSFFVASSTFRWLFCVVVIITTKLIKRSTLTPLLTQHNRNSTKLVFLFFDQPTNQANMIIKFCHVFVLFVYFYAATVCHASSSSLSSPVPYTKNKNRPVHISKKLISFFFRLRQPADNHKDKKPNERVSCWKKRVGVVVEELIFFSQIYW